MFVMSGVAFYHFIFIGVMFDMIKIRQARYEDIPRIMQFINEHWKKGHIMGNDRIMFEFQHVRDGEVFYIIAEDEEDRTIYGSMGYIPMMEQEWPCMSTVMIRSLKNPEKRMLGEEMARFFEKNMQCYNVFSVGVEKHYAKAIQSMGGFIKRLSHYYRLGNSKEFKIAQISNYEKLEIKQSGAVLVPLETGDDFVRKVDLDEIYKDYPRRSPAYIKHRYYEHPYYEYKVWGICCDHEVKSAVVMREEEVMGAKVLRMVDFFGKDSDLSYVGNEFERLLQEGQYEYIDFYCYGIEDKILENAGFTKRIENDSNIIPNYFDPFVQENVEIYFYTWFLPGIHVYRGFGDQDRPNHIINKNNKGE